LNEIQAAHNLGTAVWDRKGKLEKMNSKPARSEIRVATARFWWPLLLMAPAEQAPAP
jgi:hypothetical protein